ncbi:DUF624 domain-containing protein [Parageobacillus sp. VR-IP]|uniref:DUF624 domain-containing protein n=1 Tax=Parageobacillus sp. VR-IP TaxID=2742205 RepID=UPI001582D0D7|nr:DUF624 domain-containing protein [Parageobacillus sp. VR-IP]
MIKKQSWWEWIWRLLVLNIIWFLFSLPIVSIIPATVAMFAVIEKWLTCDIDILIYKTF